MASEFMNWRGAILKSGLHPTTRHVLLTLGCHMNDVGESCYPSVKLLSEETGLSRQTIITHLQIAKDAGWIETEKHGFKGQNWARNEYRLAWPKAVKQIDCLDGGGGQNNQQKAVKEFDTNSSENSSGLDTSVSKHSTREVILDKDQHLFLVDDTLYDRWIETYRRMVDPEHWSKQTTEAWLETELAKAANYILDPQHPKRPAQYRDWKKFVIGWLDRSLRPPGQRPRRGSTLKPSRVLPRAPPSG